jgi:hypothetical protein
MQLIEDIREEYEEFIAITKIENETFQSKQKAEYNALKKEFEDHKSLSFEDKKKAMMEYQVWIDNIEHFIIHAISI